MALQHRGFLDNDFFSSGLHPLHALAALGSEAASGGGKPIALDVSETSNAFEIKADLPGVSKKDVRMPPPTCVPLCIFGLANMLLGAPWSFPVIMRIPSELPEWLRGTP